jgi:hypothetical protein
MKRTDGWTLPLPESDGWMCARPGVGVIYVKDDTFRIRKWGRGDDPLDNEMYDTLEAAKFAVEIKYG